MRRVILFALTALLLNIGNLYAQQIIEHKKSTYIDSNNNVYQHLSLPVYVFISTTPNKEDAIGLSQTHATDKPNEVTPCYLDGEGIHTIRHQDDIENEVVKFFIHADGSAPVSKSDFQQANHYKNGATRYYGKDLTVVLSTQDNMSGVNKFYHSLNNGAYAEYKNPISYTVEQEHTLKYYAADNVGNMETVREEKFVVDLSSPSTTHEVEGLQKDGVISKYTKVSLVSNDALSGVAKVFYAIDQGAAVRYTGGILPTATLSDGEHSISYYAIDNVGNQEETKVYAFYLDKESPIVDPRIVGDQHSKGAATYVSGRTKIELTATDNKSGVKNIKYSINDKPFEEYSEPILVPQSMGIQSFRYTSEDEMTNTGAGAVNVKSLRVYVDLTPPSISHAYVGPQFQSRDTVFIRSNTDIKLSAVDSEAGVQRIGYKIGNGAENTFDTKINVETEGQHEIEYTGYDNVNNSVTKRFTFIVDNNPPIIYEHFSITPLREENGIPVYSKHAIVFLAATDGITGNKTIVYKINETPKRPYAGNISGFRPGAEYTITVEATDQIGNVGTKSFSFKIDDK